MPIEQSFLRAQQRKRDSRFEVLRSRQRMPDQVFVSYSHEDRDLAEGLEYLLVHAGWPVYVDWKDQTLPEVPTVETARIIRQEIQKSDWFFFLATENSASSAWCPWEIGYADGKSRILVIPTKNDGREYGKEYLQLYGKLEVDNNGQLYHFGPGEILGIDILSFLVEVMREKVASLTR